VLLVGRLCALVLAFIANVSMLTPASMPVTMAVGRMKAQPVVATRQSNHWLGSWLETLHAPTDADSVEGWD